MKQSARVLKNHKLIGLLSKEDSGEYHFVYDKAFLEDEENFPISVNFPKQKEVFISKYLFSFFSSLLSEGTMKEMQCRAFQIDENDDFSRLLKTATKDTIGSVLIEEIR